MIFIKFRQLVVLLLLCLAAAALAQDDLADEEAITILDQTVPVAEDGPPEIDPATASDASGAEPDEHEQLLADFERFQQLREAGSIDEAENLAKRMVETSIRISGPASGETAKALNNLAVVQHATEDYEAAQQNFAAAIEIIEDNEDQLNAGLINPLRGLGAAQLEGGRPDLASRSFGRAVHISHVNEGPHNLQQIEILEALAETNLRLGDLDTARDNHDMIYSLNLRHFEDNAIGMVPSLMRRASWQRRTGYILDERATYRRIIRIIEAYNGKDDVALVLPLKKLGESYFFVDTSDATPFQAATAASGEMYFKRAVRIATENPDADWATLADAKLALGDYYNFRADVGRARSNYGDAWDLMSADPERLQYRARALEVIIPLNADPIPRFVGDATVRDREENDPGIREGRIVVSYDVSARGRVQELKIVEAAPTEFDDIQRMVRREMRTRIFRPRYEDAQPVATPNQALSHTFYYLQEDLDKLREEAASEADSG